MKYPVNEVFQTVQGEGAFTGTPAIFIRLQGCDVGCPWCDTKHTWAMQARDEVSVDAMLTKSGDTAQFAALSAAELCALVTDRFYARHVVITGGEPCQYDLTELTAALLAADRMVQVETSGTEQVRVAADTWVTVSPKIDMPGGKKVRQDALARADEVKHPVGKARDVDNVARLEPFLRGAPIWLQPLSQNATATALCIEEATRRGWRLSVQTHKYLGVR